MRFAVLMRKQFVDNPWISYRWEPREVLPDFGEFNNATADEGKIIGQFLGRDDQGESWLFTGYELNLFPDEAEGYYLNLSAPQPCWFVMWRLEEDIERYIDTQSIELAKSEITIAVPHRISVSYNEAGRLLDGGESVDNIPLSSEHASWLQEYVNEHYRPEPKKRHRPESFKGANRGVED
ncbi:MULTISPECIES: DUF3305 domain-containing protein [unclassified Polynucleobacter]|uniref:DUF3305 domain-containing protein n=1 Tax=unclassified Polynucleobacter TaxID=2640945 RepID=UPI0008D5CB99|nr:MULTISPECIES: DUF3305 domain-containing protein [unclassified Polynucleobacter]OHC09514.1 MAG: hypothetical protein A2X74_04755 [Polynucleobacter sp. GWA2_45_21]HBK42756.1 DUF3305 domain-containing protein [Polynucleobacter sp.]